MGGTAPLEGERERERAEPISDQSVEIQAERSDPESLVRAAPSQVHEALMKYKYCIGLIVFLVIHALYIWISIRNGNSNPTSNVYISLGGCNYDTAGGQPDIIEMGMGCLKVNQTVG
jgi:hypothetical protein